MKKEGREGGVRGRREREGMWKGRDERRQGWRLTPKIDQYFGGE